MPDNPLSSVGETLQHKFAGLPVWMWVVIGGAGFWLFTRMGSNSAGSQSYGLAATPTSDQMSANAINDLNHSMIAEMDDRFGEMMEANAAANAGTQEQLTAFMESQSSWFQALFDSQNANQAALIGIFTDQQDDFMSQMAAQNNIFLDAIKSITTPAAGNTTVAPTTNDPLAGVPQWVKDRLQSPYWQGKAYIRKSDLNLGPEFNNALNFLLRSDTPSGINVNPAPQSARSELAVLIANGEVYKNPFYTGPA